MRKFILFSFTFFVFYFVVQINSTQKVYAASACAGLYSCGITKTVIDPRGNVHSYCDKTIQDHKDCQGDDSNACWGFKNVNTCGPGGCIAWSTCEWKTTLPSPTPIYVEFPCEQQGYKCVKPGLCNDDSGGEISKGGVICNSSNPVCCKFKNAPTQPTTPSCIKVTDRTFNKFGCREGGVEYGIGSSATVEQYHYEGSGCDSSVHYSCLGATACKDNICDAQQGSPTEGYC